MIHVLFNADNNVIEPCKNVMRQVMAHVSDDVTFHIMGTEFESEYNTIFYDAPDLSVFKHTGEHGHITKTACYRLFAPFIKGLDKVIYLDTCKLEKPTDVETIKALRKEALGSIYSWINDTYFVYVDRIKAAENVDLMGDIKSETFNRFNDTPQASSTGFDDDAHATNTTKTTTSSAGGTPVSRLSEVYSFIRNQYKLWADDFIQKFTVIE